jgi:hypothetical protein
MSLPSFHETLKHVVRSSAFRDDSEKQAALMAIDAHERGYEGPDATDQYAAELAKQAAANRVSTGQETDAEKIARLEADNVRLQALQAAQTRPTVQPPPPPAPVA